MTEQGRGIGVGAVVAVLIVGILAGAAGCFAVLSWQMPRLEQRIMSRIPSPGAGGATPAAKPTPTAAKPAAPAVVSSESEAIKEAIRKVNPAVVHVTQRREIYDLLWGRAVPLETGAGTGFVIDAEKGYVLTNQHVIAGADEVYVRLKRRPDEEQELRARVIAQDVVHDLAVLKIPAEDLPQVEWGDSDKLQMGDWVIALGSPYGYEHSASIGIVSALHRYIEEQGRRYEDMIQTDAAINMGNSGGPLINISGQVVGINSIISTSSPGGASAGVGFAIPSNLARKYVAEMLAEIKGGYIGVMIGEVPEPMVRAYNLPGCVLVTSVEEDSPASEAGIEPDDIIVEIDGEKISSAEQVVRIIRGHKAGDRVRMRLYNFRTRRFRWVTVTTTERG